MHHIMTGKRAILACALVCGVSVFATDYYVSPDGSDSDNDGLSAEAAFATVDKAISVAVAGDSIYVAAGTYTTTTRNAPEVKCALIGMGETCAAPPSSTRSTSPPSSSRCSGLSRMR